MSGGTIKIEFKKESLDAMESLKYSMEELKAVVLQSMKLLCCESCMEWSFSEAKCSLSGGECVERKRV